MNTIKVSNKLGPDPAQHMVGLIFVQTDGKGDQQMTLIGEDVNKELATRL